MSMFTDIVWDAKGYDEICEKQFKENWTVCSQIPSRSLVFPRPGSEKKWYGTYDHKTDGSRDRTAEKMLLTLAWYQCLGEMRFKEQRKWKEVNTLQWQHQKHWVGSPNCHLRQSAQCPRSSCGYDWRITSWSESCGKPKAPGQLDEVEILARPPSCRNASQLRTTGTLAARIRGTIWKIVRRPEVIQTVFRRSFKVWWETYSVNLARVMGSPRHEFNRRRRARDFPEPACVQTPLHWEWHTQRGEGWINVLLWYRLVGVAKTSS